MVLYQFKIQLVFVFGIQRTARGFSGGNSAQHLFGSDEYAPPPASSMWKILNIAKMSQFWSQVSPKEQKPSVSPIAELVTDSYQPQNSKDYI